MLSNYIMHLRNIGYEIYDSYDAVENKKIVSLVKGNLKHSVRIDMLDLSGMSEMEKEFFMKKVLRDLNKEFNTNYPIWTDRQIAVLTDISDKLIQYGEDYGDESIRNKLRILAAEIKDLMPIK